MTSSFIKKHQKKTSSCTFILETSTKNITSYCLTKTTSIHFKIFGRISNRVTLDVGDGMPSLWEMSCSGQQPGLSKIAPAKSGTFHLKSCQKKFLKFPVQIQPPHRTSCSCRADRLAPRTPSSCLPPPASRAAAPAAPSMPCRCRPDAGRTVALAPRSLNTKTLLLHLLPLTMSNNVIGLQHLHLDMPRSAHPSPNAQGVRVATAHGGTWTPWVNL